MKLPWRRQKKPLVMTADPRWRAAEYLALAVRRRKEAKEMRRGRDILLRVVKHVIEDET